MTDIFICQSGLYSVHNHGQSFGHIVTDINTPGGKRQILGSVIKKEQRDRQQPAWGRTKRRRMKRVRNGRNESERGIEEEDESKATLGDCGRKKARKEMKERKRRETDGGRQN